MNSAFTKVRSSKTAGLDIFIAIGMISSSKKLRISSRRLERTLINKSIQLEAKVQAKDSTETPS